MSVLLVAYAEVDTAGVFTTRIAPLWRFRVLVMPDARSMQRSHSMGRHDRVLTIVRRSVRGTVHGGRRFQVRVASHVVDSLVLRRELAAYF